MILLLNDWDKYPYAIHDLKTRNESFIKLCYVYREMGIRNCMFPISLLNPALQGIDPFSKDLTQDEMIAIGMECYHNPWFYLREIAQAPAIGSGPALPIKANRSIIGMWWLFFNHINLFWVHPRQTGKSFGAEHLDGYLINTRCRNTKINLITKDETLRKETIDRIKEKILILPSYLQNMDLKVDSNNTEALSVNKFKNRYNTHLPQPSVKRAANTGRGQTTPVMRADEVPFLVNCHLSISAALAGMGAAIDTVKLTGGEYGTVFTTTAGDLSTKEGKYAYSLLTEAMPFNEKALFDADNIRDLHETVMKNGCGNLRVGGVFSHRMLGYKDEWLYEKIKQSTQKGADVNRDFLNIWTNGAELSPLDKDVLYDINKTVTEAVHIEITKSKYILSWFIPQSQIEERLKTSKIVLGSDTSDMVNSDDTTMYLMDVETAETIATAKINETNIIYFAKFFSGLMIQYENITAIIERKSSGASIIDYILIELVNAGINPFTRLFNTLVDRAEEFKEEFKEIQNPSQRNLQWLIVKHKKRFGYSTAGSGDYSRDALYEDTLKLATTRARTKIRDQTLASQLSALTIINNRIDHPDGGHDDMVIAFLLTHWLLIYGKNLSFYGINSRKIMSKLNTENITMEDYLRYKEQRYLRRQIEDVFNQLSNTTDELMIAKLEREAAILDKKIILENEEVYSLDGLLTAAKERRAMVRRY